MKLRTQEEIEEEFAKVRTILKISKKYNTENNINDDWITSALLAVQAELGWVLGLFDENVSQDIEQAAKKAMTESIINDLKK